METIFQKHEKSPLTKYKNELQNFIEEQNKISPSPPAL